MSANTPAPIPEWAFEAASIVHCGQFTIEEAAAIIARHWSRETQALFCAFCGESYPPGTPTSQADLLSAHIRVCSKHPMRHLEESNRRLTWSLRSVISRLETADSDERERARDEGRSAIVNTSLLHEARGTLDDHGAAD